MVDVQNLHRMLVDLHGQGKSAEILEMVDGEVSALEQLPRDPRIGSIYRYAMLAHYRRKEYPEGDVWWERAMNQFSATEYLKGIAYLLVTPAFRSLDLISDHGAMQSVALMVIKGVEAIAICANETNSTLPTDDIMAESAVLRVAYEKHAYCLFRIGRFTEAVTQYHKALDCVPRPNGPADSNWRLREELKVRGGLALAQSLIGDSNNLDIAMVGLDAIRVRALGNDYLMEVQEKAIKNLEIMRDSRTTGRKINIDVLSHFDIR